jgi:hypothetical protein
LEARAANLLQPENSAGLSFSGLMAADAISMIDGGRQVYRQCDDAGRRHTPQLEKSVG